MGTEASRTPPPCIPAGNGAPSRSPAGGGKILTPPGNGSANEQPVSPDGLSGCRSPSQLPCFLRKKVLPVSSGLARAPRACVPGLQFFAAPE